jgi:flagellar biosynthesis/type III secretory pathway protein FliH
MAKRLTIAEQIEKARNEGFYEGAVAKRKELDAKLESINRFQRLEDALNGVGSLARANAEIATAMAQLINKLTAI